MDKESRFVSSNTFLGDPIFLIGLCIRVVLITLFVPEIYLNWFIPFLEYGISSLSFDPWSAWLTTSEDTLAYPYGPIMYLSHLPGSILGIAFGNILGIERSFAFWIGANLLLIDIGLLWVLLSFDKGSAKKILLYYWLSPIVLYVTYWNGQVDVVPTCLLVLSLFLLKNLKIRGSAVLFGLAISAKMSMLLATPFIFLYLLNNKRYQKYFPRYAIYLFCSVFFILGPFMFSEGFKSMVMGTPEIGKIYSLYIEHRSVVSDTRPPLELYLMPITYLLVVYWAWRVGRMSYDLLFSLCGIGFFVVLLLTPASPGWFLWVVPFLVIHQINSDIKSGILILSFSLLFIMINLFLSNTATYFPMVGNLQDGINIEFQWPTGDLRDISVLYTLMEAIGVIIAVRLYRLGIVENDFYLLGKKPIVLGIAGGINVGKKILSESFTEAFGSRTTSMVSLEKFKKWSDDTPIERVSAIAGIPRSYNLNQFAHVVIDQVTLAKVSHRSEKKLRNIRGVFSGNDMVVAEGPFVLLIPTLQDKFTVRIFLEMDGDFQSILRKINDAKKETKDDQWTDQLIENMEGKYSIYGKQQYSAADICFKMSLNEPVERMFPGKLEDVRFRLNVLLRRSINIDYLVEVLITDCHMDIDVRFMEKNTEVEMVIGGYINEEQVQSVARKLVPHLEELMDLDSKLARGIVGLMQLVILNYIGEKYYSIKDKF